MTLKFCQCQRKVHVHQDQARDLLSRRKSFSQPNQRAPFSRYKKGRQSLKEKRLRRQAFKRLALQQQFVSLSIPRPDSIPAMVKEKIHIKSM